MLAEALRLLCTAEGERATTVREVEQAHRGRSILTRADQLIYAELDPLTEVYLLIAGTVRLFVGEGGAARTTLLLEAPAVFGDRDVLAGLSAAQESARSVSRASLLCYERAELEATFGGDEALRRRLAHDLLLRSARAARFAAYLAEPLERRLLWLLFELNGAEPRELPGHEALALMSDSSVKSVGRALRALQETDALAVGADRRASITPCALEELAGSGHLGLIHRLGAG